MLDRSINVLRKPKCLCCIPMETGCFIFGVFSSVLSGFSILALCFTMSYVTASMRGFTESNGGQHSFNERRAVDILTSYVTVVALFLAAILTFIFSVFLCYGVQKRRAGFVKAYLVYGIVKSVLLMLAAIVYSYLQRDMVGGSFILIGCGIYSLILLTVHRTYELFRTETILNETQQLETKPCMKA